MRSELVQLWIKASEAAISDVASAIPLIDARLGLGDLDEELHQIWNDGDVDLYDDFVEELLKSPSDIAVRFAALNAYYLLMEHKRDLEESDMMVYLAEQREEFREKLAFFVGFQPVETCTDLRTIRWEIVNACAAKEFGRAYRLCGCLESTLPKWRVSFTRGWLRFLVAHVELWGDPRLLSIWDLPFGPESTDPVRALGSFWVIRQLLSRELPTEISDEMKSSLRTAISELEIARDGSPAVCIERELMLARCYAAVGQYHEAARLFQIVIANRDILRQYFRRTYLNSEIPLLEPDLFHRSVTSHQRAEELELAIGVAQDWINEFPDSRDAYPLMARLHTERGDQKTALEWYRKGAERFPELGDDWDKSFILQLAETSSPTEIDRKIEAYSADHRKEIEVVRFALSHHWPAFARLDEQSKERWSTGIVLLNAKLSGLAVYAFSGVLERLIRESLFIPFREDHRRNPAFVGDIGSPTPDTRFFCDFLRGKELTFGQMLEVTMKSAKSVQVPFAAFAGWLKEKHPGYFKQIGKLDEHKMTKLRNQEAHFNAGPMTEIQAEEMLTAAKEMISFITSA